MFIMNCTQEEQTVRAYGSYFSFKPGQIKNVSDHHGHFIVTKKRSYGLAGLPDEFEDLEYRNSEAGKAALEKTREAGLTAYLQFHQDIIRNNQVSLRRDLEKANIKADPLVFASEGELQSMEIVAKYQKAKEDATQKKVDRAKELLKTIKSAG